MIRPMTSDVSTLSSFVAKSHQAIHFVSSTPSKIPYGGFSPVRLQTRFRPRPPSRAGHRQLIGRHCLYLRSRRLFRSGTCVQAAPRTSDQDHGSNGPWLPNRFYCPVGSSLTMAISAPLNASGWLMNYSHPASRISASLRGSPIYSASPCSPCRRPYSGGPSACTRRCLQRWSCLRQIRTGSTTTGPTNPNQVGRVTKLQHSLTATARTFTTELAWAGSPLCPRRLLLDGLIVIYHRRTFTGWTGSLMGCKRINTIGLSTWLLQSDTLCMFPLFSGRNT